MSKPSYFISIFIGVITLFFLAGVDVVQAEEPMVRLIYPNNGEVLNPDEEHTITWEQSGVQNADVQVISLDSSSVVVHSEIVQNDQNSDAGLVVKSTKIRLPCNGGRSYKIVITGHGYPTADYYIPRVTDESDKPVYSYYVDAQNTDDMFVNIVEPLSPSSYNINESFKLRVEYKHVDFFSCQLLAADAGRSYIPFVTLNDGLAEIDLKDCGVGSTSGSNLLTAVKISGNTYTNRCREINNFSQDVKTVSDISNSQIFTVGHPNIWITNPDGVTKWNNTPGLENTVIVPEFVEGGYMPIRWNQSGPIKKVDIAIVPVYFRSQPSQYTTILAGHVLPTDGAPYASYGSFDWLIPENFYPDIEPDVPGQIYPNRRFEFTIHGFDSTGKEIFKKISSVFVIRQKEKIVPIAEKILASKPKTVKLLDSPEKKENVEKSETLPELLNALSTTVLTPTVVDKTNPKTNPVVTLFSRSLRLGMSGLEVLKLQKFLNSNGFVVSKSGAGSPGKEITKFGPATKAALIKFQRANGIPATGFFGPMTIRVINKK